MTVEFAANSSNESASKLEPSSATSGLTISTYNREASALFKHYNKTRGKADHLVMEWKDICYETMVSDPAQSKPFAPKFVTKKILQNVSGVARSGEMLAIMGPTGCGKTSFLNIMAARVSDAGSEKMELTGTITVNGEVRHDNVFRKLSAYVQQDDKLYAHLTVFETLQLAAFFYLPLDTSLETKTELVDSVIMELGLEKARATIIGDDKMRGISGGERKRTSIAVQLISDPAVLFLDEPTSGLDSFQAMSVMESMKSIALNGRLVMTVIHQPRSSIFELFDKLLLLSEGRQTFLGSNAEALAHFAAAGFDCPKYFNPADFYLDVLSPDSRSDQSDRETAQRIDLLAANWTATAAATAAATAITLEIADGSITAPAAGNSLAGMRSTAQAVDCARVLANVPVLLWRAFTEVIRDKPTLIVKFCLTVMFACIIGAMYSSMGYDQAGIHTRAGLLFVITINQGFNGIVGVLNSFPKEKVIVNRERADNAYDAASYFFAKFMAEIPTNFSPCVVFGTISFWVAGLNPSTYGVFILILMLQAVMVISLGLMLSALAPTVEVASALGIPAVILALIFGGFYINIDSLPPVARWLPYVSFVRWAFSALMINEFKGETFTCSDSQGAACIATGDEVLLSYNFGLDIHEPLLGMGLLGIAFFLLALLVLHRSLPSYIALGFKGKKHVRLEKTLVVAA